MIALRCTAKLLDRLGIERHPPEPPPSTSRLGDWTATYLVARPRHLVVAMNARTGLVMLLPGSELGRLPGHFQDGLARLLGQAGIPGEVVRQELEASTEICYGATRDRSATGMLSQAVMDLKGLLRRWPEEGPWAMEDMLLSRPTGRALMFPGVELSRVLAPDQTREAALVRLPGPPRPPDRLLVARGLPDDIQAATLINAGLDRIWTALATAEGLDPRFTAGADVDTRPGGRIRFRWVDWGASGVVADGGIVFEAVVPRRLVIQRQADTAAPPTTVTLTLEAEAEGTRVRVRESGFRDTPAGRRAQLDCAAGWGEALALLKAWLEAGQPVRSPRGASREEEAP
jgi:uncharacterized protein YndB with AHSA1/START domain